MPQEELGPRPEPEIEPGEPNPGGVDAIPADDEVLPADLSVEDNPAIDEDAAPDEIQQTEDTSTEGTEDSGDGDAPPQEESTE